MTITSRPPTDEYRDGWERVFGKPDCAPIIPAYFVVSQEPRFVPANEYSGRVDAVGHLTFWRFGETNE